MRVVVSDTSPLRALAHLGRLDLLTLLLGEVIVPTAVAAELAAASPSLEITAVAGVRVVAPADASVVSSLRAQRLDAGESEAIALALELHADLLLIDERRGEAAARQAGLATLGVLGLLITAKQTGHVPAIRPLLDDLQTGLNFFIAAPLRERVLKAVNE